MSLAVLNACAIRGAIGVRWTRPILALASLASARKKPQPQHAPLPAKVLLGKTIFIDNQSGWAEMGDKAYSALKA